MLSSRDIINAIEENDCPVVIYSHTGLPTYLPDLETQLRNLYFLQIAYTDRIRIFTAKKNVSQQPDFPLETQFGRSILLKGFDLPPASWHPAQRLYLATYWTALTPPEKAYKIFLHLRNEQNETVAKFDHFPFPVPDHRYQLGLTGGGPYQINPNIGNVDYSGRDFALYPARGMVPTTVWPVGLVIREVTMIELPADLPSGAYHLYIGLYEPDTLNRLPLPTDLEETDEILLATVEIYESD
jgi:hypothetical protein